jgi:hypothetical protein
MSWQYQGRGNPHLVAKDLIVKLAVPTGNTEEELLKAKIAEVVVTYLKAFPDAPPIEVNIHGAQFSDTKIGPAQLIISVMPMQGFLG